MRVSFRFNKLSQIGYQKENGFLVLQSTINLTTVRCTVYHILTFKHHKYLLHLCCPRNLKKDKKLDGVGVLLCVPTFKFLFNENENQNETFIYF